MLSFHWLGQINDLSHDPIEFLWCLWKQLPPTGSIAAATSVVDLSRSMETVQKRLTQFLLNASADESNYIFAEVKNSRCLACEWAHISSKRSKGNGTNLEKQKKITRRTSEVCLKSQFKLRWF